MNDRAASLSLFETLRLRLLRLSEGDAAVIAALFADDWEAVKQTGQLPFPSTEAAMKVWVRKHTGPGGHSFLLRLKADDRPIGAIGFGGRGPVHELGYALGRAFWGQGYATEAAMAVVEIARAFGLGGLQAYSFVENPASARVLEKAGFANVGTIVREYPKRGGMRRVIHFRTML